MKQATIVGERQAAVLEMPAPSARENWVVVKVHVAPMCTEYKAFLDGTPHAYLGHEAAGEVVEVARPGRVKAGDRVVVMPSYACGRCDLCLAGDYIHCERSVNVAAFTGSKAGSATMAQYLIKPDWLLVPIPDDLSYEHAAMACCGLGPTFGAMQRLAVDAFDTVLITGLGPVGLGGVINARYRGARVIGVEANAWRARLACRLGAETVVDPRDEDALAQIRALTQGRGVDKVIDCSGVVAAHRLGIDAAQRRGMLAFVGESSAETPIVASRDMIRKGLTLMGSWHYNLAGAPRLMQVIRAMNESIDRLISHTFPLDQIQQAFELQVSGQCAKVLLKPWAEEDDRMTG